MSGSDHRILIGAGKIYSDISEKRDISKTGERTEMFFMMGITDGRKELNYSQTEICSVCGCYGRYQVFMTYTVLSLFFIPCFKWNRHYYVQTSCCNTLYELDREVGRRIERGENVRILAEHLQKLGSGRSSYTDYKRCLNCGYETTEDFVFCPKCGARL